MKNLTFLFFLACTLNLLAGQNPVTQSQWTTNAPGSGYNGSSLTNLNAGANFLLPTNSSVIQDAAGDSMIGGIITDQAGDTMGNGGGGFEDIGGDVMSGGFIIDAAGDYMRAGYIVAVNGFTGNGAGLTNLTASQISGLSTNNYNITLANSYAKSNNITEQSALTDLQGFFGSLLSAPSGSNRLAQLNDFWILNSRFGSLTNSYNGVAGVFSNNATRFGRSFVGSGYGVNNATNISILPISANTTNTVVIVLKVDPLVYGQFTSPSQNGTIRSLGFSMTDTNTGKGYYFMLPSMFAYNDYAMYFDNGGGTNFYKSATTYDTYGCAFQFLNDNNGTAIGNGQELYSYAVVTLTSDGIGHHWAWCDGVPCLFNAAQTLEMTNNSANTVPSGLLNAIKLSSDTNWILTAESHEAGSLQVQAVFVFNGGYDANMGADTYNIASWLPNTHTATMIEGTSLMSLYEYAGSYNLPDYYFTNQLAYYLYNGLGGFQSDDLIINRAAGGSSIAQMNSVGGGIGILPLTPLTGLPKAKYWNLNIITDHPRNDAALTNLNLDAGSSAYTLFNNYYTTAFTNGVKIKYLPTLLLNTNNTFFNTAYMIVANTNITKINALMRSCPIISGYYDHYIYEDNLAQTIVDSPTANYVHPCSTNAWPYLQAYANYDLFGVKLPVSLQPTLTNVYPATITFPATGVNLTNYSNYKFSVHVDNTGVTGTITKKNGVQVYSTLVGDVFLELNPSDYFSETYSVGTPVGTISPIGNQPY